MTRRIERVPLPELPKLRRALAERSDSICPGARLVDADVQGPTGVDIILVDDDGRPVFVDVVRTCEMTIPVRVFEHVGWMKQNNRLLLRAYARDGLVRTEEPVFVFIAPGFSDAVVSATAAMTSVRIRLVRAEYFSIDGDYEIIMEDVTPAALRNDVAARSEGPTGTGGGGGRKEERIGREEERREEPHERIESEAVRSLLALFKSGVDGLDGSISAIESNEGFVFNIRDKRLASVSVSPGSFTVSPGDGAVNPIVVSDRVSLERALNAVVSLFVREDAASSGGNGGAALGKDDKAELEKIWGAGVVRGDGAS